MPSASGTHFVGALVLRSLAFFRAGRFSQIGTLPTYSKVAVVLSLLLLLTTISFSAPTGHFIHLVSFVIYLDHNLQGGDAFVFSSLDVHHYGVLPLTGASRHYPSINST